ncbi:tensin-3 isoform X1 [Brienomyrus brachyistius]|uniref:tensin-3 isoform X1 n=1 Tax=Brienomyrus brachyistius TaxID=42636 RepID=UPI0020B33228|nr:tensin-3 isoform X1 [Brienomyrus brachyistius]
MEEGYEVDLTYITERIIAVSFPRTCTEESYLHNLQDVLRMLRSKHGDNYLVINLSEKRYELSKMNPKTMDTGWPDLHAPPLDKMCTICKAMETWLNANPQHVVVIHCRGGKGRIGVVISSYVHFTNISASADQALDRFAMRRYHDDKVSALMTPSQKRYVWILNSLLTGCMKMNTSLVFLHHVVLHGIPDFDIGGVCRPYLKVYQGMQAVYTSGIYHISPGFKGKIYITLEPAQLLKGDIMIKCYHKSIHAPGREVMFRIQFHTGIIHGCQLTFDKEDLEHANKDPRFPDYGKIELVFSEGPEKLQGSECWQNGPEVTVDYNTSDPMVRWDSYENLATDGDVVHAQGPVDGSLYAKVRKKSTDGAPPGGPTTGSLEHSDHALSASSDSGLSSTSLRIGRGPSQQERAALQRLLSGIGLESPATPGDMVEQQGAGVPSTRGMGGTRRVAATHVHANGERETDILDDEAPAHDLHSADSIGTLSSSEGPHSHPLARCACHQSSQNSLLSDGFGGHVPMSFVPDDYERGYPSSGGGPLPQGATSGLQAFMVGGYSTQTWVRQQQMVAAQQYSYPLAESEGRYPHDKPGSALTTHVAPEGSGGHNSAESPADRELGGSNGLDAAAAAQDDELASLTVDIDQSIDQLNQLIMDLDPTFVPIPTQSGSIRRDGKSHFNGSELPCANGGGHRPAENQQDVQPASYPTAGHTCDGQSDQLLGSTRMGRDVVDHQDLQSSGWGLGDRFQDLPLQTPELLSPERSILYTPSSVEYGSRSEQLVTRVEAGAEMVPATPAFPVSPPTPYVKNLMDLQRRACGQPARQYDVYRIPQNESRGYVETMSHGTTSPDDDLFRTDASGVSTCQGAFGSARSVTLGSPLLSRTESPSSQIQQSSLTRFTPPYPGASELSPPTPNYHSSPRGTPHGQGRGLDEADATDLPSLLGNGSLERSLLEAMESLGGMQPPLPEKRRISEGEHSLGSGSPALSGFSSPHSGSTISIPFPSVLPDFSSRVVVTSSPLPDLPVSKPMTVKFVQDTSKFWYKPDISRDQAIAALKDKDPGSFIVRDSHSFRGAYGLAMKVATPPPSVLQQSKKVGDLSNELVRHFLIECTQKGVRLKGCPNEPYFGSLTALVCQHSITPLALPCRLIIPSKDPLEDIGDSSAQTATNSAVELLKQGAACNVWFLGSVEMESLTGYQAVQKATSKTLSMEPPPTSTVVHFKVSAQGITLTDNQRKLFFRRHYAVSTVIFCSLDPQNRRWTRDGITSAKIFGFVARKTGSSTENVCHVFAEHDPEQPASAIVNFVSKVMIGSQKSK